MVSTQEQETLQLRALKLENTNQGHISPLFLHSTVEAVCLSPSWPVSSFCRCRKVKLAYFVPVDLYSL